MIPFHDILDARVRIQGIVHNTPLIRAHAIGSLVGCELYLKAENLQRTGSFKIRGAANRMALLSARERARGVIAASVGNHAQGVALAARESGVRATIVMPTGAPFAKVEATGNYGAEVLLHGNDFDEAMARARELAKERNLTLVHAYDDLAVIAGQGTVGVEIAEALPEVDIVLVPVGGGGLLAGTALAVKSLAPHTRVIGVQAVAASAWFQAFRSRALAQVVPSATVADGIAVGSPGKAPSELIWRYVDDIITVGEEKISQAMVLLLEWGKLLVEGAGAVGMAALLDGKVHARGQKVAVVLSGGNLDPTLLARIVDQGLAEAGRFMVLRVLILDRPGRLALVLACVAASEANVLEVHHHRKDLHLPVGQVEVELLLETKGRLHADRVLSAFHEAGYELGLPAAEAGVRSTLRYLTSGEAARAQPARDRTGEET